MNFHIFRFDKLLSTNEHLKKHLEKYDPNTIIWADEQEKGRGRFERTWLSAKEKDLTFSILLLLDKNSIDYWKNITQVTSLAIVEELEKNNLAVKIKWPNDVIVNDKKVCGILCELVELNGSNYGILGIGLNVNSNRKKIDIIDQPATSIYLELNKELNREELLKKVSTSIIEKISILMESGFSIFKDSIMEKLAWLGEYKVIEDGSKEYEGKIIGLNNDGTLKFQYTNGAIVNLISGEIRFKKG